MKKVSVSKVIIFVLAILFAVFSGVYGRWYWENQQTKPWTAGYIDIVAENKKRAEAERQYIAAMTADTYGGKTPEETLQLFIKALKAGDIELASKYFALETNTQDPNYLTRKKWEEGLIKAKQEGRLGNIIDILSRAVRDEDGSTLKNTVWFIVVNQNNPEELEADIELKFNTYSQVWKIESL